MRTFLKTVFKVLILVSFVINLYFLLKWRDELQYNRSYIELKRYVGNVVFPETRLNYKTIFQDTDFVLTPIQPKPPVYTLAGVLESTDFSSLQDTLRSDAIQAFGLEGIDRGLREFTTISSEDKGEYILDKVAYTTQTSVRIPAYLLKPKSGVPPWPAIVVVHGCGFGKAGAAGMVNDLHSNIGVHLVKEGFIVLIPDRRGFGELQTIPHYVSPSCASGGWPLDGRVELEINALSTLGVPLKCLDVYDIISAIDYLADMKDVGSLGITGVSSGGIVSLYVAGFDERVRAIALSGAFTLGTPWPRDNRHKSDFSEPPNDLRDHLRLIHYPMPPELTSFADDMNVISTALLAPRPLLLQYGKQDDVTWLKNGHNGVEYVRQFYKKARAEDNVELALHSGGHKFYPESIISFFNKNLK